MTLSAFAAERRAAALLLLSAGACYRSITPARGALSSKPAARSCRTMGQTDGRTLDRFIDTAAHTLRAVTNSEV